ncbi:MAG: Tad domain-containing protein [Anaerolineae bacterium]|nr:Tad domain-containing protein [Phycisphaerae bacterium]
MMRSTMANGKCQPRLRRRRYAGITLIYATVVMVVLCSFVSLGVDYGRVQLAKTELQRAADAGSRYGASGLKNILYGVSAARANAVVAAKDNLADGSPVTLDANKDVELIIWDAKKKTATVTTDPYAANAVRVTARRTAARGNPIPMTFARLAGVNSCDASATSISMLTPGADEDYLVEATNNPYLSGMPPGTIASNPNPHNNPDYSGSKNTGKTKKNTLVQKQSPVDADIPVVSNAAFTFDGINGNANNDINDPARYTADGNTGWITKNHNGAENGISDLNAPINSLVAVFLDDTQPNTSSAPSALDFGTAAQRDFTTLQPKLKQPFFIGDGRTSTGEVQQFIAPPGATRLFIGTWDSYEWNNNVGEFYLTIHRTGTVQTVK